jgi:hypothetical protein
VAKRVGGDRQVCVFVVCMRVWMWMPALGVTAENKKQMCAKVCAKDIKIKASAINARFRW